MNTNGSLFILIVILIVPVVPVRICRIRNSHIVSESCVALPHRNSEDGAS
jgi:hypothetical protein